MTTTELELLKLEVIEFYSRMRGLTDTLPKEKEFKENPIFMAGIAYGEVRLAEAILQRIEKHQSLNTFI